MNYNTLCLKCMHEKANEAQRCRNCGFDINSYIQQANVLPVPSILKGRYYTGVPLGIGGFGITYIAFDMKVGGICAVKEYMPDTIAYRIDNHEDVNVSSTKIDVFEYGLTRFSEESTMLQQFLNSKTIINVFDSFMEHDTSYYVMEYINGHDFVEETKHFTYQPPFHKCAAYFVQVLDGLQELHTKGVIHRDISPDNLYITRHEKIKILDFGSARYALTQKDKQLSVIVKVGYAPKEQYSAKSEQGPWTDIYALCATMYHILSGVAPPDSTERMEEDSLLPLHQLNHEVPVYFSEMIMKGMAIRKQDRFQNVSELKEIMNRNMKANHIAVPDRTIEKEKISLPAIEKHEILYGRRIGAIIIDGLIDCCLFIAFIYGMVSMFDKLDLLSEYMNPITLFALCIYPVILLFMNILFETSTLGGTIGKLICGIKIVDENDKPLANSSCLKRNIIKLLSVFLLFTEVDGRFLHEIKSHSKIIRR